MLHNSERLILEQAKIWKSHSKRQITVKEHSRTKSFTENFSRKQHYKNRQQLPSRQLDNLPKTDTLLQFKIQENVNNNPLSYRSHQCWAYPLLFYWCERQWCSSSFKKRHLNPSNLFKSLRTSKITSFLFISHSSYFSLGKIELTWSKIEQSCLKLEHSW